MTGLPFEFRPWQLRETSLDPEALGVAESLFALGNGHVGFRGTLDEMQPSVSRGTFMSGVHEHHPLSYPEGGYGDPQEGQAIVGVAEGTAVHVQVDGAGLDLRETPPEHHERILDLRTGTVSRQTEWTTARGQRMRLRSTRLVSLVHRTVSIIRWELQAVDRPASVVVRSVLRVNGAPPQVDNADPRVGEVLSEPFRQRLASGHHADGGFLVHRTAASGIGVGAALEHVVEAPDGSSVSTDGDDDQVTTTIVAQLAPGQRVVLVKSVSHVWSPSDTAVDLREQAIGALAGARELGWQGLLADQQQVLDDYWEDAAVEIDGDPELRFAVRFALFQALQAVACIHGAPVGAKGLTGSGYSGHTFWDIDGFLTPALTLLRPEHAARLLQWRSSTLDHARERARVLGLPGAVFPWRTIDGRETSAYWPASTAAMHLQADISRVFQFWADATGQDLTETGGTEVLVETARLWAGLADRDHDGGAHLRSVTGPDEYTGVVDDNVFTNLMARWNLRAAADACGARPEEAERLSVGTEEPERWRDLAAALHIPYDDVLGVHPANEGFTGYREWDFAAHAQDDPVQERNHYLSIYRHQVVKQADLVHALWWCAEEFTADQVARDLDYYERRTVRDSSLSAAVQSVVCARVGHLDLAVSYLREAALTDLGDLRGDTAQGLHLASLAGAWLGLVTGLGGLRVTVDGLELAPRLPQRLGRVCFRFRWRGRRLAVETTAAGTEVRLLDSAGGPGPEPVRLQVEGTSVTVAPGRPVTVPLTVDHPVLPEPQQPPGRGPRA